MRTKKFLSILLTLAMVLSLMPATALAVEGPASASDVAFIDLNNDGRMDEGVETGYADLKTALAAVGEGQTIQLLAGTIALDGSERETMLPTTMTNVTIKGAANHTSVIKDGYLIQNGSNFNLTGVKFEGVVFEDAYIVLTPWDGNSFVQNFTVNNCIFRDLDDANTMAPIHVTAGGQPVASGCIKNFTFTNNMVSNLTGGNKSGIYANVSGTVTIEDNTFDGIQYRSMILQVYNNDGTNDTITVEGNTISDSANGRIQILGAGPDGATAGTDTVSVAINENIFTDITQTYQFCVYNFNPSKITTDLSKNYYDVDITANPSQIYYEEDATDVADLIEYGVYPIYTELNEDDTINTQKVGVADKDSLTAAIAAAQPGDTITLLDDVTISEKINVTQDLIIEGNNKTLTYTGSGASARAIDVANTANGADLSIYDLTIDCTAGYCQRGINYNTNGTLTLDGVIVKGVGKGLTYAVNLPGSSDNATVDIDDCTFTGAFALNIWGSDMRITVDNSSLYSVGGSLADSYAVIALNNDGTNIADGTDVLVTGGVLSCTVTDTTTAYAVRNRSNTGTVTTNGTQIIGDVSNAATVALVDYGTDQFYSYLTLQDAINKAILDGGVATAKLLQNVTEDIEVDGAAKLNLNGKSMTGTIILADAESTLSAPEGLTVVSGVTGYNVVYAAGTYSLVQGEVTGVSLNKTSLSLNVGGSETLVPTVSPSDAANKAVTWESSNTSVATVDASGKVTAGAAGSATITVKTTDGNFIATCAVTVTAPAPSNPPSSDSPSSGGTTTPSKPTTPAVPEAPKVDVDAPTVDTETKTDATTGSTTTTETKQDGTVVESTTNKDGSSTTTASKTETTTNKDGSTTTTTATNTSSTTATGDKVTEEKVEQKVENKDGSTTTTTGTKTETTTASGEKVTEEKVEQKVENKDGSSTTTTTTTSTATDADGKKTTSTTTEEKKENKDGSSTTTTNTTTKEADGTTTKSETVAETKVAADGTETTTAKTETSSTNGSKSTVTVAADGTTTAEVKVSSTAVKNAEKAEEPVALPMPEVAATTDAATAPTVEVSVPSGGAKVEIPVEDVTPGTVAVMVLPDGTEKIVKTSTVSENGLVVDLEEGATIKVVDNTKEFDDVEKGSTFDDAIAFVSSRELFGGTAEGTFSPNNNTTRAQLMTVLARLDGETAKSTSEGMEWAKENGISDGTNAGGSVTRQQMAVMLWRYAGSPDSDHPIDHVTDGHEIADYAETALRWAMENGILGGYGDGSIRPQAPASRAHMAAFMQRYCGKL